MEPKVSRREEIKMRLEINEIQNSGTIEEESMKPMVGSLTTSVKLMILQPGIINQEGRGRGFFQE